MNITPLKIAAQLDDPIAKLAKKMGRALDWTTEETIAAMAILYRNALLENLDTAIVELRLAAHPLEDCNDPDCEFHKTMRTKQ